MDLIIRDARLRHRDGLADVGIAGGRIEAIAEHLAGGAAEEIDAAGRLTTPSFVEPHIHLDKALTAERARENATNAFEESIAIMREVKRAYTVEDVADRATRVIHRLVSHGVTLMRSYVDRGGGEDRPAAPPRRSSGEGIELDAPGPVEERLQVGSLELDIADEGMVRVRVEAEDAASTGHDVSPELRRRVVQHHHVHRILVEGPCDPR